VGGGETCEKNRYAIQAASAGRKGTNPNNQVLTLPYKTLNESTKTGRKKRIALWRNPGQQIPSRSSGRGEKNRLYYENREASQKRGESRSNRTRHKNRHTFFTTAADLPSASKGREGRKTANRRESSVRICRWTAMQQLNEKKRESTNLTQTHGPNR